MSPKPGALPAKKYGFGAIKPAAAQRVVIYGPGGVGKTSLAARAPGPVAFFDLDQSLANLSHSLEGLDVRPIDGVATWQEMRDALHQPELWKDIRSIVIDSGTRAEFLGVSHTIKTVPHEKPGTTITSVEGYGYGKGYRHVYETFMQLLGDLDQHFRAGRNVVLICHDCTANVPNPEGVDYIRWEPRLQNQTNGNIRFAVKEWCDHLLCVRYDVSTKDGKAEGSGSRTIYPVELPVHMAKSRSLKDPIVYEEGSTALWDVMFNVDSKDRARVGM